MDIGSYPTGKESAMTTKTIVGMIWNGEEIIISPHPL
jgi:hypothetical protein